MIKKYGGKRIVSSKEKVEGYILESSASGLKIRKYCTNEHNVYDVVPEEDVEIEFVELMKYKKPLSQVRCISRQFGSGDYVISEFAAHILVGFAATANEE